LDSDGCRQLDAIISPKAVPLGHAKRDVRNRGSEINNPVRPFKIMT
jgi:hypothetical protein